MIIKSSTALRNDYPAISGMAHDSAEPIYITKNGEGDLVLMSIEAFEKREEMIRLKSRLAAAERTRLAGFPTHTTDQVREALNELFSQHEDQSDGGV